MTKPKIAGRRPAVLEMKSGTYHCCACGLSDDQPFCDGSHHGTELTPTELKIDQPRRVALCMCKQSETFPLCDGAHKSLPADDG